MMKILRCVVVLCLLCDYLHASNNKNESLVENRNKSYIRHSEPKQPNSLYYPLLDYCQREATCQELNFSTCMGAKLPYRSTTLELTDLQTQEQVQEKLVLYQYLRYIPKCWAVIQPFLCALYMPKCEKGLVVLPSREMCRITLEPCKILYNSSVFPEFLNCEDTRLFPSGCKNDIHDLKFNTTGYCMDPLVKTDKPEWFYPDVEGCGLRCKDSLYTENEHFQINKLIAYCVTICILFNLFTIITFIIDWNTANKYPALAIFYVNVCFCISYSGWLVQFLGNETRDDVVCKKDGTLRKFEPSASENLSCVIVFVMVYYFLIAGMVWFVIFSYAWHMSSLYSLGKIQERVDKKRAYFHLVAWSLPLVLTITTMAIGEIGGDYVTGICFVGFVSMAARSGLLLTPLAAVMMASGYVIVRGLILLVKVKMDSREIISQNSSRKIRSNIVRMGVFAVFMVVFCIITFGYHNYTSMNSYLWDESLKKYIFCKLTSLTTDFSHCKQEARPSVAMLQLQLLAAFGAGLAMASWVWCDATLHAWGRYIRRKFDCEGKEPMKIHKHEIIAQTFAKKHEFNEGDRISILVQYPDVIGLQFDLNSDVTNNLSSSWTRYLPRIINRRGAITNEDVDSASSTHSFDSEVSLNVRHVSIESRRNSGDSQVSVQISEYKARTINKKRRKRKPHDTQKIPRTSSRQRQQQQQQQQQQQGAKRGSSTSLDSHMQLINVLTRTDNTNTTNLEPNLDRRLGNVGVDPQVINNWLSKGTFVRNTKRRNNIRTDSEDENVSVTISESRYNIYMTNHNNLDLNDRLILTSLKKGIHIEELNSSSDSDNVDKKEEEFSPEKHQPMAGNGRDSHASRTSKRSKRSWRSKKYSSSDTDNKPSDSDSSCPENKQLVHSVYLTP